MCSIKDMAVKIDWDHVNVFQDLYSFHFWRNSLFQEHTERMRGSPGEIVEGPRLVQVSLFRNNRLVEDGLAKECVYSATSHGQSDTARACARHVCCSRVGLLASSSHTLQKVQTFYIVELTYVCRGVNGCVWRSKGKSSWTKVVIPGMDANVFASAILSWL